jgi:uncharacterized protein (DUF952 family)
MSLIYHIATASDWEQARRDGEYTMSTRGTTLEQQGFIHASTLRQVMPVANTIYAGDRDLVLLVIDETKVAAEIRYEPVPGSDTPFPHIYGPLNIDSVVETLPMEPDAQGLFSL